jgi:hypothetical protein
MPFEALVQRWLDLPADMDLADIAPCRAASEEYDLSQGSRNLTALLCAALGS